MVDIAVVSATAPVFVDPGGRRRRVLTAVGVGGALLLATYLLALIAALTGAPWVPAIGLPGVDAPAAVVPTPDAIASSALIGRVTDSTGSASAAPAVGDGGSADLSSTLVTTPSAVPPPAAPPPAAPPPVTAPPPTAPPATSPPATAPPPTAPPVTSPPVTSPPAPTTTLPPQTSASSTDLERARTGGVGGGNGRATAATTG